MSFQDNQDTNDAERRTVGQRIAVQVDLRIETSMDEQIDYNRALLDPASVFSSPEHVLERQELSREQKIEILHRWAYDASEVAVAEEEGMPGDEPLMLRRVLLALDQLEDRSNIRQSASTKHGGV